MIKAFIHEDDEDELIANTYVMGKPGGSCLVVDLGDSSDKIVDFVKANYKKVSALLLTHAHFDHIRGVSHFLASFDYKIPVYLEENDYVMLMTKSMNGSGKNGVECDFDPILVKDNQELVFGDSKIKVIHTPFHTPGSACFLSEEDNALFTGDTLFKGSIGRDDLPGGEPDKVSSSLKKLLSLSDILVCYPGHGEITSLGKEKKTNQFLLGL
jgi:glyoxylase-like metal-dependent hydrolase (beta-lactamase superfamily II)